MAHVARHCSTAPVPSRAVAQAVTTGLVGFQLALAGGAPWGAAAWGGQHPGPLPTRLRRASLVSAGIWAGAFTLATTRSPAPAIRHARYAVAALGAVGTVMNAASRSPVERVWSPVSAVLAVCMLDLARSAGTADDEARAAIR